MCEEFIGVFMTLCVCVGVCVGAGVCVRKVEIHTVAFITVWNFAYCMQNAHQPLPKEHVSSLSVGGM